MITEETMQELANAYAEETRLIQTETDREMEERQAWDNARTYCPHDTYTVEYVGYEDEQSAVYVCDTCGTVETGSR